MAGSGPGVYLEVGDVLRRHGDAYRSAHAGHLGRVERRVMGAIMACRTAALGGHVEACDDCGVARVAYNSCRNRHCPKCQGAARAQWLAARQAELLPVPYFHVVFTLPAPVGAVAFQNKAAVYAILFAAAAEAMMTLAANPRRLGAQIGVVAVLHTWGQALTHHPHVHCVVPGGGLSPDGTRWIAGRPNFFLAVRPLAKLFRRLFLERLQKAYDAGALNFFGDLVDLANPASFEALVADMPPASRLGRLCKEAFRWNRPGARLSRSLYTPRRHCQQPPGRHRRRSRRFRLERIIAKNSACKIMKLVPDEFIRRFLLHTLPDGFHRIRHFGFMANGCRAAKLALCRSALLERIKCAGTATDETTASQANVGPSACPECGGDVMRIVATLLPRCRIEALQTVSPSRCDTSCRAASMPMKAYEAHLLRQRRRPACRRRHGVPASAVVFGVGP